MNLDGIIIVSGKNCPSCTKLINMMKKTDFKYRVVNQQEVAELKIINIPMILKDGVRLIPKGGCPGSVAELKRLLRK